MSTYSKEGTVIESILRNKKARHIAEQTQLKELSVTFEDVLKLYTISPEFRGFVDDAESVTADYAELAEIYLIFKGVR